MLVSFGIQWRIEILKRYLLLLKICSHNSLDFCSRVRSKENEILEDLKLARAPKLFSLWKIKQLPTLPNMYHVKIGLWGFLLGCEYHAIGSLSAVKTWDRVNIYWKFRLTVIQQFSSHSATVWKTYKSHAKNNTVP